jgi:hypothetical protein
MKNKLIASSILFALFATGSGAFADYAGCMDKANSAKHCELYGSFYSSDDSAGKAKCLSLLSSFCKKNSDAQEFQECAGGISGAAQEGWNAFKNKKWNAPIDEVQGHFMLRYILEHYCIPGIE